MMMFEKEIVVNQHTIFFWGYSGHKPADLQALAEETGAMIVDARMSPFSRNPTWNKSRLQSLPGLVYHHMPAFGNPNYKNGGPLAVKDMETGIEFLDALNCPAIIMCMCKDANECHTSLIQTELDRRGYSTKQLRQATRMALPNTQTALF